MASSARFVLDVMCEGAGERMLLRAGVICPWLGLCPVLAKVALCISRASLCSSGPSFGFMFCFLALHSWAGLLNALCLSVFICKLG